jgi:hypothetical protein
MFLRNQVIPATVSASLLLGIFELSIHVPRGWASWAVGVPASSVIVLTALARANDIRHDMVGVIWHLRRLGYVASGTAAVTYLAAPLAYTPLWPSWRAGLLQWGIALAWITTPGLPPWNRYITGKFRKKEMKHEP